jgi:archaellum component FlaC
MNGLILHRFGSGMMNTATKQARMTCSIGPHCIAPRGHSRIVYGNKVPLWSVATVYSRGKTDVSNGKELVDVQSKGIEDCLNDFSKRIDDFENNIGKRLDDFSSRLSSHERLHLFFLGTVVVLFGLTIKCFGDLNNKIDDFSNKLDRKFDDFSNKLDRKFDDLSKKVKNISKEIHVLTSKSEQRNSHLDTKNGIVHSWD